MPKRNIDYSKTVIYKIVCNNVDVKDLYVGSTTNFTRRKTEHRGNCLYTNYKPHHFKIYQTILKNGGWENWSMIEIEKYPCNDGNEAKARERFWLEGLNATLNMAVPSRSNKEWFDTFREQVNEKSRIRWHENRESNLEKHKIYYENNKDIFAQKSKEKYEKNKEDILKYQKEYYKRNRDKKIQYQKDYRLEQKKKNE